LKVAKKNNFTYFQKLREEIVDIFTQDEVYISFDGLFNFPIFKKDAHYIEH
jgi:hypothetical protein